MTDQVVGHSGHKPTSTKTAAERAKERKAVWDEQEENAREAARQYRESNRLGEYANLPEKVYSATSIEDGALIQVEENPDGTLQFRFTSEDITFTLPWDGSVKKLSGEGSLVDPAVEPDGDSQDALPVDPAVEPETPTNPDSLPGETDNAGNELTTDSESAPVDEGESTGDEKPE